VVKVVRAREGEGKSVRASSAVRASMKTGERWKGKREGETAINRNDRFRAREQTTPITVYETPYVEAQMRMIAVNGSFICYGIRNGLIRVFSRASGNVRSLLRGHSDCVSALKFLADTDILLSVDVRGRVTVRKLTLDSTNETIGSQTLVDFDLGVDASATTSPPSACWLPLDPRKPGRCEFALSVGTCVVCYECKFLTAKDTELLTISLDAPPAIAGLQVIEFDAPVSCVDSAPQGRKLVAASEGRAYVLIKADGEEEFECTDTLPWTVETALFASATRVILGNKNNTELVVVDITSPTPVAVQRVVFTSANDKCFNVSLQHNPASGIVTLSNTRLNTVFAMHFGNVFDYVTRFETSQPVLSFDARRESDADGDAIKLFCLGTQAIQTLRMPIEACMPPPGSIPSTPTKSPSKLSTSSSSGLLTPDMFLGASLAGDEDEDVKEDGVSGRAKSIAPKEQAPAYETEQEVQAVSAAPIIAPSAAQKSDSALPVAAVDVAQLRAAIRDEMQGFLDDIRKERQKAEEDRKKDLEAMREANEMLMKILRQELSRKTSMEELMSKAIDEVRAAGAENTKKIEAGVARTQSAAATSAQTAVKSIVGPAIDAAVRAQMETSVVPRFESACGEMFKQVKATFEKGMSDLNSELLASRESAVMAQAAPFVSGLRAASNEVRQAATVLLTDVPNQVAVAIAKASVGASAPTGQPIPVAAPKSAPRSVASIERQIEQQLDPTMEIGKLLQTNQIDKAFNFALSLSKVEVVMWLVNQVSSDRIFAQTPCPLSQGVLLSLVQQLSTSLNTADAPKKLDWIRDACLAVDPANPALRAHMKPVLTSVHQALMVAANSLAAAPEVRAGTRLCIHVVNSMLTACS